MVMQRGRLRAMAWVILAGLAGGGGLVGCHRPLPTAPPPPDYSRPLPPGTFGLRRITDPLRLPDLAPVAAQLGAADFRAAAERSLGWFAIDSTRQFFPSGPISHAHAWASVYALHHLGGPEFDRQERFVALQSEFDVWESVGWDGSGEVLFTAYFTPVFKASRTRTPRFRFPLYKSPPDLRADPITGEVIGTYPTRAQLMASGKLDGLELVYLPSRLDAYIIEVNGSAKLNMRDGSVMYVGFAGTNGRQYTSIGRLLAKTGAIDKNRISLASIRDYFRSRPDQLQGYISQNQRFVFFQEYDGSTWPAGSLGVQVTPWRTVATDKGIFPRGSVVLLDTTIPTPGSGTRPFYQLVLDQDTGGAIRAAGRADIYLGIGDRAERIAGRQAATGRMFYLLLKPERVQAWYDRMMDDRAHTTAAEARLR